MENQMKKKSLFQQTEMEQGESGNQDTYLEYCKIISDLFAFPEGEDVSCLAPFIGDAEAVVQVTKKRNNPKIFIFGVELDKDRARHVQQNNLVEDCIYGDYLADAVISENSFSFCFVKPTHKEGDENRLEVDFLKKTLSCLMEGAVIVYIVSYFTAAEQHFLETWTGTIKTERAYKFHDCELDKRDSILLIGRKEAKAGADKYDELETILKEVDTIPVLPSDYSGEKIIVNPSPNKGVSTFKAKFFDAEKAEVSLKSSVINPLVEDKLSVPRYITDRLSRPPIMPNAGQMYLMAISGAGQGRVGTEAGKDQHLQRGVVTKAEESEYRQDEKGNMLEAVQQFTRISFNIIENSGIIHKL